MGRTTSTWRSRRLAMAGTLLAVTLGTSGCGVGMADLPLPGTSVSGDTITVNAEFEEALNLAEGGLVRVNGVDSGKVQGVTTTGDFKATVEMKLQQDAQIRQGATARLRYTTPLGELFVDITNPTKGELLGDGAELTEARTETAPTVEQALSQASLLINGGGLGDLQVVTQELNTIFNGRERRVKSLLRNSTTFMETANSLTGEFDVALSSLNAVSKTLDARKETIHRALREIAPAARVLRENTPAFTRLLNQVENFARVANRTVGLTRRQLLQIMRLAGPVLREFSGLGRKYPTSLTQLVRLGGTVDNIVPNDYVALSIVAHLNTLGGDGLGELLGIDLGAVCGLLPDNPLCGAGLTSAPAAPAPTLRTPTGETPTTEPPVGLGGVLGDGDPSNGGLVDNLLGGLL